MIKYLYLLSTILMYTSCATPYSVIRLQPMQGSGYFVNGVEVLTKENENMKVVVYPNYDKADKLSFTVSVLNKTDTLKTFSSDMFSIYPLTYQQLDENGNYDKINTDTILADDPEAEILQNDIAKARSIANEKNVAAGILAVALVGTIDYIANQPNQNNKVNNNNQVTNINHFNYYPTNYQGQQFSNAEQAIDYLKQKSFRKNTTPIGQANGGTIFFNKIEFAPTIMLRVKFEDNVFLFPFEQKKH